MFGTVISGCEKNFDTALQSSPHNTSDPNIRPVGNYFVETVESAKEYAMRKSNPSNVVEETFEKERIPGRRVVGTFGKGFDRQIKRITRGMIESVVELVVEKQKRVLIECASKISKGELTVSGTGTESKKVDGVSDAYPEYRERFVDAVSPWVSRLNTEAEKNLKRAVGEGFGNLAENASYFMCFEGGTFEEIVENAPREEAEKRLNHLVEYVDDIRRAFEKSSGVYAVRELRLPGVNEVRLHFRREAMRIFRGIRRHVSKRVDKTIETAYLG